MPKGPRGEKRPADVIGNAVFVMRLATGEIEETLPDPGKEYARKGGLKGGKARAAKLRKQQKQEIARKAAAARWGLVKSKAEATSRSTAAFMASKSRKVRAHPPKTRTRNS